MLPEALDVLLKWHCATLFHGIFLSNESNINLMVFSLVSDYSEVFGTRKNGAWFVATNPLLHCVKPDYVYLQFNEKLL